MQSAVWHVSNGRRCQVIAWCSVFRTRTNDEDNNSFLNAIYQRGMDLLCASPARAHIVNRRVHHQTLLAMSTFSSSLQRAAALNTSCLSLLVNWVLFFHNKESQISFWVSSNDLCRVNMSSDGYLFKTFIFVCLSELAEIDDGGQTGHAWRGHYMDAGRRALAVSLGPGGHEAGLQPELEPRRICGCRVPDRTRGGYVRICANNAPCQNCERLQWR